MDIECEVCGGNNFYTDAGFYYCRECQTQSQEVREQEFQVEFTNVSKIRKLKQQKEDTRKVTSWECYNILLYSLTQQLIKLGAEGKLKDVIKCLWMRYLEKLEVVNLKHDVKPKLQLVNYKKDMEILYGKQKKKRKRTASSSDESAFSYTSFISARRERTKRTTAMAEAQYEEIAQKSNQDSISLRNETLSSLKGSSDKGSEKSAKLEFNRYSKTEIKKNMSPSHFKIHQNDLPHTLTCHKLTTTSNDYQKSVYFLSPIKIYSILYLGLLIIKDKIQLGDLFRFIKEERLSFNNYIHLFPEEYVDKFLNIHNNKKNQMFVNRTFRIVAAKLMKFLEVTSYIQVPDLKQMSSRYCKEMNLPHSIRTAVHNLISKTLPKFWLSNYTGIIPNYEGRVMSIILFVLKLLYGLDGVTEFCIRKYARALNEQLNVTMFDITKWLQYISYRHVIVAEYHLPSCDTSNMDVNSDLLLQYIKSHDIFMDNKLQLTKEMDDHKQVLESIQRHQQDFFNYIEYPAGLTPFYDYTNVLLNLKVLKNGTGLLRTDFGLDSLDFLLYPYPYLKSLNPNVELKNGGANDNWFVQDIKTKRKVSDKSRTNNNLIPVELVETIHENQGTDEMEPDKTRYNAQYIQEKYEQHHQHVFYKNSILVKKLSDEHITTELDLTPDETYAIHCNPYERYWLNFHFNMEQIAKDEFENFYKEHPRTFQLAFEECSRVIEQNFQELFEEFQLTELFLVYSANYGNSNKAKSEWFSNTNLNFYVTKAKSLW